MAQIGWGRPRPVVRNRTQDTGWRELPTPADGTFELATEKGDKLEAKLEGGAYEDVQYKGNTNTITFDIRVNKNRKKPFDDNNGIIAGDWEFYSQPEDPTVPAGLHATIARISCEVKSTSADGTTYTYTVEPLQPEDKSIAPLEIGLVTYTEDPTTKAITGVTFTKLDAVTEPDKQD